MKRTPMKRSTTGLKRKSALKSSQGMKRGNKLAAHSATSVKGRRSEGRAEFVKQMIASTNGRCLASIWIRYVAADVAANCLGSASEVHEPLTRARGGATDDPNNGVPTCRYCHSWIHDHSDQAWQVGLLLNSTEHVMDGVEVRSNILHYGSKAVRTL